MNNHATVQCLFKASLFYLFIYFWMDVVYIIFHQWIQCSLSLSVRHGMWPWGPREWFPTSVRLLCFLFFFLLNSISSLLFLFHFISFFISTYRLKQSPFYLYCCSLVPITSQPSMKTYFRLWSVKNLICVSSIRSTTSADLSALFHWFWKALQ